MSATMTETFTDIRSLALNSAMQYEGELGVATVLITAVEGDSENPTRYIIIRVATVKYRSRSTTFWSGRTAQTVMGNGDVCTAVYVPANWRELGDRCLNSCYPEMGSTVWRFARSNAVPVI